MMGVRISALVRTITARDDIGIIHRAIGCNSLSLYMLIMSTV